MKRTATTGYIMEDPREAGRLEAKVDADRWVRQYVLPMLPPSADLLSVGCGPGVIARTITELDPLARVTGVDISEQRIEEAKRRNQGNSRTKFVCGNACKMEFPDDSFDIVYSRLLLEYLKDRQQAVKEMVRVCKPGGRVLLQDLDGQLLWNYPEDAELQRAIEKVTAALALTGFDPFVGRKLFWLAQNAGLTHLSVQIEPYHVLVGTIDDVRLAQWEMKFEIAKPQMTKILGSEEEAVRYSQRFLQYLSRPDTLTYSVSFTVTGEKPL